MRLGLLALICLTVAVDAARADDHTSAPAVWLCAPPQSGPFNECWKGNSMDEAEVARCSARQATRRPRPSRLRLDVGPWIEFPPKTWRCVALPADRAVRVTIENFGRSYASWRQPPVATCRSGVLDIVGPNFYGAIYARCSRRAHTHDERLPAP